MQTKQQHTDPLSLTHAVVAHGTRPHLIKAALCAQIPVVAGSSPTKRHHQVKLYWLKAETERWSDMWTEEGEAHTILTRHHTNQNIHALNGTMQTVAETATSLLVNNKSPWHFSLQVTRNSWHSSSTVCILFTKVFCRRSESCQHNIDLFQGALFPSTRTQQGLVKSKIMPQDPSGLDHTHRDPRTHSHTYAAHCVSTFTCLAHNYRQY